MKWTHLHKTVAKANSLFYNASALKPVRQSDRSDVTGNNKRGGATCKHAGGAPSGRLSVTACPRLAGGAVTDGAGVTFYPCRSPPPCSDDSQSHARL